MAATEIGLIRGFGLLGGGSAFPKHRLSNADVLRGLPSQAWGDRPHLPDADELRFVAEGLEATLGVRERSWAHVRGTPLDPSTEENTLDLAVRASQGALKSAGVAGADLRLVLATTSTPHRMTSTLSAPLGATLGAHCACMDVRTGCAGGLFALSTAALYSQSLQGLVLLVGSETFSKIIPAHKVGAVSLADGSGALVLGPSAGALLGAAMETDGRLAGLITTDGALPPTQSEIERGGYQLSGTPAELTRVAAEKYVEIIHVALARAGLGMDAIDLFVPHQTSKALIQDVRGRLGISEERTFMNLNRHANIGVAGWMVALIEAREQGRLAPGAKVLLAAVGGGMSWAAAVLEC